MTLTADQRRILTAIVAITAKIATQEPLPWWGPHEIEEYNADVRYGPLWAPGMWFKDITTNAETVRLTRVLKRLEADGLVYTFRRHGRKCTHVRLTTEGEVVAKQITTPATPAMTPERTL